MSLNGWEILLIAVAALLIFGGEKLPGMARKAGATMRKFQETLREVKSTVSLDEPLPQPARVTPAIRQDTTSDTLTRNAPPRQPTPMPDPRPVAEPQPAPPIEDAIRTHPGLDASRRERMLALLARHEGSDEAR